MDNYNTSALGLQKRLLNLRRDHAQKKASGDLAGAAKLAELIKLMEHGLEQAPKPVTLQ